VIPKLLASKRMFTALVSYNDIAAIGAIRALRDAGLRVPEDVSVIGFDDIQGAAYHTPSLTTIRQPLNSMGNTAARLLLQRIRGLKDYPEEVSIVPELIIRESTLPPNPGRMRKK
jgi:LacI family transcriptional regulator